MVWSSIFQIGSYVAAISSGAVVVTGTIFPMMMLSFDRPYSHIIFWISFCDFIASIGNSIGFPENGSRNCIIQAVIFLFFNRASWIFTTSLVYQLHCILIYKKLWLRLHVIHICCWGLSLILTFLPLSTNPFGIFEAVSGESPCNIGGNEDSALYWELSTFEGLAVLCFLCMTLFAAKIFRHFVLLGHMRSPRERALLRAISYYPLAMFVCWFPTVAAAYTVLFDHSPISTTTTVGVTEFFVTQYGTLSALIFFANSQEARRRWSNLVCKRIPILNASLLRESENENFIHNNIEKESPENDDLPVHLNSLDHNSQFFGVSSPPPTMELARTNNINNGLL